MDRRSRIATAACVLLMSGCSTPTSQAVVSTLYAPYNALEWAVSESTGINQGIEDYYFPEQNEAVPGSAD